GRLITPTVTSRCVANDAVRMRNVADLPHPGAPVTRAKPPSPASCCTRQQNDSRRRVTCNASVGTLGVNGFHLRPYSASILLFTRRLLRPWGGRRAAIRWRPAGRAFFPGAVRCRAPAAASGIATVMAATMVWTFRCRLAAARGAGPRRWPPCPGGTGDKEPCRYADRRGGPGRDPRRRSELPAARDADTGWGLRSGGLR